MTQSSYLMLFIKTLMENDTKENREKMKKELEREYHESGAKLHTNLSVKYKEVSKILSVYREVAERIKTNKKSVAGIKNDLLECKSLLQCNRDELRRLWLDHVEKSRCSELLDQVDRVKDAPERVEALITKRAWLEATEEVQNAQLLLTTRVNNVQALLPVKTHLTVKNKNLVEKLKQELHRQVFLRPSSSALRRFHREEWLRVSQRSSGRSYNHSQYPSKPKQLGPSQSTGSGDSGQRHFCSLELGNWRDVDIATLIASFSTSTSLATSQKSSISNGGALVSTNKSTSQQPSSDWTKSLVTSSLCLHRLSKLTNVISEWRIPGGLQSELHKTCVLQAVQEVTNNAAALGDPGPLTAVSQPRYLVELLEILFDMLFMTTSAILLLMKSHQHLLTTGPKNALEEGSLDGFDEAFVRSCIQNEIQNLLAAHLDVTPGGAGTGLVPRGRASSNLANTLHNIDPNAVDLSAYFGKKRLGQMLFSGGRRAGGAAAGLIVTMATNVSGSSSSGGVQENTSGAGGPPGPGGSSVPGSIATLLPGSTGALASGGPGAQSGGSAMFSFGASSHALSVNSYIREVNIKSAEQSSEAHSPTGSAPTTISTKTCPAGDMGKDAEMRALLVCQPSHANITAVYTPLMEFIRAFEEDSARSTKIKKDCQLRNFIVQFIQNVYMPEVLTSLKLKVETAMRSTEAFHTVVSQKMERELALNKPILIAVVKADECLTEVKQLTIALPDYTEQILKIGLDVLSTFKRLLWQGYNEISKNNKDGEMLVTAEWAKDENIIRIWKKLPSWVQMAASQEHEMTSSPSSPAKSTAGIVSHTSLHPGAPPLNPFNAQGAGSGNKGQTAPVIDKKDVGKATTSQESTELLRIIHEKFESTDVPATASDDQLLKRMACLHESVAWLVYRLQSFERWLSSIWKDLNMQNLADEKQRMYSSYAELTANMNHLADSCLLMVHLDCRLLAYNRFNMLPEPRTYSCPRDEVDVDPHVTDFIKSLTKHRDILSHTFSRHKLRFVFNGLGHFISLLLIRALPNITRMNNNGVKKMCRNIYQLHQALTVLTQGHETDLVRVKQLYELLHLTPHAVINKIMEQGALYEESVYKEVLLLHQRSNPTRDHMKMKECLSKLREVIHMEHV